DQLRWTLRGRTVEPAPELVRTSEAVRREPPEFGPRVVDFFNNLPSQLVLDDGRLNVSHAGLPEILQGAGSAAACERAIYGPSTGALDSYGFPERISPTPTDWAEQYTGTALVVHGHKALPAPRWIGRTLNIDSNCSRGGALTAFRYPEQELVSIPA